MTLASKADPFDIPEAWLFPDTLEAASQTQRELAERVLVQEIATETIVTVGGVDVSNNIRDPENWIYTGVVCLEKPGFQVTESIGHRSVATMPYVPGFLAFREVPALIETLKQLTTLPDILMVDGHGVSHPRGLGIASHLGVLIDRPTIGVAKRILIGRPDGELGDEPGSQVPLVWKNQVIGMVLRTRRRTNPVYVSVGHRITLEQAVGLVQQALTGYRLPEPTRQAHLAANMCRKSYGLAASDAGEPKLDNALQA
jgi:deoxyribonuclease V